MRQRIIGQALTNVLKNAVEAVESRRAQESDAFAGKIAVELMQGAGSSTIRIVDNGIGLPQSERHRLTEPYVTTRVKGTGLGLAIVKKIIEDHGGTVGLDDAPGGGAVVTFTLNDNALAERGRLLEGAGKASRGHG